jgi:hypothetical protein
MLKMAGLDRKGWAKDGAGTKGATPGAAGWLEAPVWASDSLGAHHGGHASAHA